MSEDEALRKLRASLPRAPAGYTLSASLGYGRGPLYTLRRDSDGDILAIERSATAALAALKGKPATVLP